MRIRNVIVKNIKMRCLSRLRADCGDFLELELLRTVGIELSGLAVSWDGRRDGIRDEREGWGVTVWIWDELL